MSKTHYVNNADLLAALIEYKKSYNRFLEGKEPRPEVSEYLGECILKISEHLGYRPNFMKYPFRGDMIGDAVENMLRYLHNYDETRSNPFAYLTQIAWYAFIRRIAEEKKQLYVKYSAIQRNSEFQEYVNQEHDDRVYNNTYIEFLRKNMTEVITEFEDKKAAKKIKNKAKANSLEKFFDDEPESFDPGILPKGLKEELVG